MVGFGDVVKNIGVGPLGKVAADRLQDKRFTGGINKFLFGQRSKTNQKTLLTPEQQQLTELINEGLTKGTGPFAELLGSFDEGAFEKGVSEPAMKQFQDKILPQIQEKFIAGNQVLGSGMRQGQLDAATDLQSKLAGLRYNAQQQQQQNRMGGLQTALGVKGFENVYKPGTEGFVKGMATKVGETAVKAGMNAMAG